jgi:microcystin-dependent protein
MALSGTLSTKYKGYTYRVDWSAKQSVSDNYSDLTLTHKLICDAGWDLYIAAHTGSATVGGVKDDYTAPKISTGGGTTINLGTTTHRVTHNDNGTKTGVAISATFNIKATIQGTYKASLSVSGTVDLDTIPRASQPSCITWPEHTQNVGYFGDTISIHMNRKSDVFTHTVRYGYGTGNMYKSGTIATGVTTGTTWTIPLNFMDNIPNGTSGSGTIHVDTYDGSTLIGTKSCGFTAKVPASVKPTCTVQVLDATDYQKTYGNLVQGLSKLSVKVNGYPAYSSPIASYKATANGKSYTADEFTTDVLTSAGTTTVSATVTDKRGRTSAAASASFQVLAYTRPSITALSVHRCDQDGTENDQGEFVQITFSAKITALNNKNSAAYTLRWKKTDEADYPSTQKHTFTDKAGQYTVTDVTHIFPADSDYSYDVEVEAKDNIETVTRATSVSTGYTLMDWNDDGKSLAFGKVSEEEGTMEIALDVRFLGKIKGTIFDAIYPVGSIYLSYNHVNPATLFGGTWERIENRFLWACDAKGEIGTLGGEKTHTLTAAELPAHSHRIAVANEPTGSNTLSGGTILYRNTGQTTSYIGELSTKDSAAGAAHNNMPPYIQVSIWHRTA